MNRDSAAASVERIEELLYVIRGRRIMLDSDLAPYAITLHSTSLPLSPGKSI